MIRQHLLQQERIKDNHERLLERYHRLLTPKISQSRLFGTSPLPGRNYDRYLRRMNRNYDHRDSTVAVSRAGIGSSSEIYRWLGDGVPETLPRNVSSIMQHTRDQSIPLVHAEKFEPVQVYEHPLFGRIPAYIRPVFNERSHSEEINNDHSDNERDGEVPSLTSNNISSKLNQKEEIKISPNSSKNINEDSDNAPKGYITYTKWKTKYENLIPVDPLLYNIHTRRPNGSIHSYGQSLYESPNYLNRDGQSNHDENPYDPFLSDIDSVVSDKPRGTSTSSSRRYQRLQPSILPTRPLEPIRAGYESDISDDKPSPPDSPVPYLSRNKPAPIVPPMSSPTFPSRSITPPSVPTTRITSPLIPKREITSSPIPTTRITTPPTSTRGITTSTTPPTASSPMPTRGITALTTPTTPDTPRANTTGTSPPSLTPATTSNIPPAPPMPSSLTSTNVSNVPPAPPMPSSLSSTTTSNIPPAPPMPTSLLKPSFSTSDKTPSRLPIASTPITRSIPAPPSTSGSTTPYQPPSYVSLAAPSVPPISTSTTAANPTKAVTFSGSSSIPLPHDDISSSSDSDEDKRTRQRRKKRQAAAATGIPADLSSSDD